MPNLFDRDGAIDFDYNAIDREETPKDAVAMAAEAFTSVMDWITKGGKAKQSGIVLRTHVWIWVVRPEYFRCASEEAMAKRLGVLQEAFAREVTSFRSRFGFKNRLMKSDEHRKKIAMSISKWHADAFDVPIKHK